MAAVESAKAHVAAGTEDVYLAMCSYTVPEEGHLPIWHGGEVAYIFKNEAHVLVLNEAVYGEMYGNMLSTYVLNFVKTGDPNNKYMPKWEKVTAEDNNTMIIDKSPRCVAHHDDELIQLCYKAIPPFVLKLKLD